MQPVAALPFTKYGPWTLVEQLPILGIPLQVHAFGMLVAIGLILCLSMATWRGEKKMGMNGEKVQNFGLVLIGVGWTFAHVFNVIFYSPGQLLQDPLSLFKIWGSVSSYGGLLGGMIGLSLWRRTHPDDDFMLWTDHATWTLTFAWMFGRLGCTSVHDHLGATASAAWPLAFEMPEIWGGGIRHDLGFYEFLWWGVIVATVLIVDRKPRRKGIYTVIVPLMYAPVRFTLDFMRLWPLPEGDGYNVPAHTQFFLDLFGVQPESLVQFQGKIYTVSAPLDELGETPSVAIEQGQAIFADTRYLGLTPAQYLSIGLFVLGIVMWYRTKDNEVVEWREYDPEQESN